MGCTDSKEAKAPKNGAPVKSPKNKGVAAAGKDEVVRSNPVGVTESAVQKKLYGHPVSQPSRSVQWFVDYAKLDVEVEHVDIMTGKNKEPEFVAKFPNAKVPSFEKGDFKLEEGAAILQYLAEGHAIVPKTAEQRARVTMMIGRNLAQARKITVEAVLPLFFGKEGEKAEAIKAGIEKIRPELAKYDTLLSASKYLVGDELSLADFMFVTEVDQLAVMKEAIGTDVLADYPHITAYLQRIAEVPGYKKCVGAVADIMAAAAAAKKAGQ
eukprot:TRINITY_DN210_c0_g1_i5.p2 TRINITY_DN210_c0_g1~~TRINITY_DN210_c0_g1_i5.p2  ORF type:complete len:290 (+),score=165.18 TRINITY_DN210_c0_g1_i5:67-870(+)